MSPVPDSWPTFKVFLKTRHFWLCVIALLGHVVQGVMQDWQIGSEIHGIGMIISAVTIALGVMGINGAVMFDPPRRVWSDKERIANGLPAQPPPVPHEDPTGTFRTYKDESTKP